MWPNGQVYEGEFKNDECFGPGTLHYPDGKKFVGHWKDGKKHGQGKYEWPNGAEYWVQYQEGQLKGESELKSGTVNMQTLKSNYASLGKKTR